LAVMGHQMGNEKRGARGGRVQHQSYHQTKLGTGRGQYPPLLEYHLTVAYTKYDEILNLFNPIIGQLQQAIAMSPQEHSDLFVSHDARLRSKETQHNVSTKVNHINGTKTFMNSNRK
jgi:hypothetical protein